MGWGVCLCIEIMIFWKERCEDDAKKLILYKEQTMRYGCICVLKSKKTIKRFFVHVYPFLYARYLLRQIWIFSSSKSILEMFVVEIKNLIRKNIELERE